MVVKNDTAGVVLPQIEIFLFDAFGLQVGKSTIEKRHATSYVVFAELSPGESRSYHAKLDVERESIPRYYLVRVE